MNEIFEFRRFGTLALKWFRENRKVGFIFLAVMVIVTFLSLCKFNPFLVEYYHLSETGGSTKFIQHYKAIYESIFWGLFGLFSLIIAFYSLRDFVSKERMMNALLVPASMFEKYLLAFLNSTVVIFVVYLLLFYGLASITNSYKFVGISKLEYVEGGIFENRLPVMSPGQQVVHSEIGNVLRLDEVKPMMLITSDHKEQQYGFCSKGVMFNLILIWFLYWISLGMWGSVTFRKHPFILTFLLHTVFFMLLIGVSIWFGNWLFGGGPHIPQDTLSFYGSEREPMLPSKWWVLLFYAFPLAYLVVTWMKLKTKQIQ